LRNVALFSPLILPLSMMNVLLPNPRFSRFDYSSSCPLWSGFPPQYPLLFGLVDGVGQAATPPGIMLGVYESLHSLLSSANSLHSVVGSVRNVQAWQASNPVQNFEQSSHVVIVSVSSRAEPK